MRVSRRIAPLLAALLIGAWAVACASPDGAPLERPLRPAGNLKSRTSTPPPVAPQDGPLVVFLGDSLTAGFGLAEEQAYPALVERALRERERPVRVVNAGLSGDTTAGGLRRVDWVLRQRPEVVVIALGGNDGLRGLDLEQTEHNLRQTIEKARAAGARVLLAGMLIPPSYGPDYTERFAELYPRLAAELDVPLIPFLLDGVAAEPQLNLADGIHPNAAGQKRVAAVVLPHLQALLDSATDESPPDELLVDSDATATALSN